MITIGKIKEKFLEQMAFFDKIREDIENGKEKKITLEELDALESYISFKFSLLTLETILKYEEENSNNLLG